MRPFLQFTNIQKRFGSLVALEDITLAVNQGSTLALLGPNGAGKSTLFSCLLGFATPTAGSIHYRGERLTDRNRPLFGYVSERVALYPNRSVLENATFFAELKGCSPAEIREQLKRVRLEAVVDRKVRHLSKGMLQRLGLAIALQGSPELLVLDEPFNGLDPVVLDEFSTILREEQSRGATIIISTHTISAVERLATHVAVLLYGTLAFNASVEQLRKSNADYISLECLYQRIARQQRNNLPAEVLV